MFKLIIIYVIFQNYPLTFTHTVEGFPTVEQCQTFGIGAAKGITETKGYVMGKSSMDCVKVGK